MGMKTGSFREIKPVGGRPPAYRALAGVLLVFLSACSSLEKLPGPPNKGEVLTEEAARSILTGRQGVVSDDGQPAEDYRLVETPQEGNRVVWLWDLHQLKQQKYAAFLFKNVALRASAGKKISFLPGSFALPKNGSLSKTKTDIDKWLNAKKSWLAKKNARLVIFSRVSSDPDKDLVSVDTRFFDPALAREVAGLKQIFQNQPEGDSEKLQPVVVARQSYFLRPVAAAGPEAAEWMLQSEPADQSLEGVLADTLKRANGTGLTLYSNDPGLTIFLDGETLGNPPVINHYVREGRHVLRLEKLGRPAREVELQARAFRDILLRFDYPEDATTGNITVNTWPAGRPVLINGVLKGKSPVLVSSLARGEYKIEARRKMEEQEYYLFQVKEKLTGSNNIEVGFLEGGLFPFSRSEKFLGTGKLLRPVWRESAKNTKMVVTGKEGLAPGPDSAGQWLGWQSGPLVPYRLRAKLTVDNYEDARLVFGLVAVRPDGKLDAKAGLRPALLTMTNGNLVWGSDLFELPGFGMATAGGPAKKEDPPAVFQIKERDEPLDLEIQWNPKEREFKLKAGGDTVAGGKTPEMKGRYWQLVLFLKKRNGGKQIPRLKSLEIKTGLEPEEDN